MTDHCSDCTPKSKRWCGFCGDGPYSPTGPFATRATKGPQPVTGESLLAEFDARAKARREEVAAEFQAFDAERRVAKKKRRTKKEVAEARAAKQRQITDSYNSLVPAEARSWLDAPDEVLDRLMEGLPRDPQA